MAQKSRRDTAPITASIRLRVSLLAWELRRPLAVTGLLIFGTALFSTASALLGTRDDIGTLRIAGADAATRTPSLHALPARRGEGAFAAALTRLKSGPFGVELRPANGPATAIDSRPMQAAVLIDAAQPPLRVEIMGLGHVRMLAPSGGSAAR